MLHHQLWLQVYLHLGHYITNFFIPVAKSGNSVLSPVLAILPLKARLTMFDYLLARRSEQIGKPKLAISDELLGLFERYERCPEQSGLDSQLAECLTRLERLAGLQQGK